MRALLPAALAICTCLLAAPDASADGAEEPGQPAGISRPAIPKSDLKALQDPALRAWVMRDWRRLISISGKWAAAEPANPAPWRYLGDGYFGLLAMPQAQAAYRKALELEGIAEVWESLGEAHLWQGIWYQSKSAGELAAKEFDEALRSMESALAVDPSYTKVMGGIGALRYHQQKFQLALAALESALDQYPKDARSWHYLGMAYAADGDDASAVSAFQAAAELTYDPMAQLRNWLLLRQSAQIIGREDLVGEADQKLERIGQVLRERQMEQQVARIERE